MKSKICLIRHGITRGNRDRLYYGQSDIPLIEDGEKEISRLAKEGIYPDSEDAVYYTTGLQRTEQTFGLIYGDKPHDRIELLQEIRQNYADFVLRDFARRKHVSSAYLCKVLKEATGKNCTALLQERRIEKAKRMLRETDLSVMEICAAVGYSNSSYFYRIFESATGMSPSAWRVNSGCDERR